MFLMIGIDGVHLMMLGFELTKSYHKSIIKEQG